ncbi:unnamed protein product [Urochloa humidicola]
MARVLPFVEFVSQRRRCPSSPDHYSPLTAAVPSPRAASPEYTPVSLRWRPGTPEHAPSTALRLGPPVPPPPPLRRAVSPDYSPSSSSLSRPASPEYTPLARCGWRAAGSSPDYAPSTPSTRRAASPDYALLSIPPAYAYRVASPEYTPVSRLWRAAAGSPEHRPANTPPGAESPDCVPASSAPPRRGASPDYTPRTPPARAPPCPDYSTSSPPVSDAESGTSSPARRYRQRHHPYQRSGAGAFGVPVGSRSTTASAILSTS